MLKLTRLLYPKTFVELSFLSSMISKKDLNESLFWIYELYYSGFDNDAFSLIYQCYFDFYALQNVSFINIINKNFDTWYQNKDPFIIGCLVKFMFYKNGNMEVFELKQMIPHINSFKVKKGTKPKWMEKYHIKYGPILRCIDDNDYSSMIYKLKRLDSSLYPEYLKCLYSYFKNEKNKDAANIPHILQEIYDPEHEFTIIYLIFITLLLHGDYTNHRNTKTLLTKNEKEFITEFEKIEAPLYEILKNKRIYSVDEDFIISYDESLQNVDVLKETRENWRLHSKETPFWKKKFESDNEEDHDFDFEYDEQPLDCQEKSIILCFL